MSDPVLNLSRVTAFLHRIDGRRRSQRDRNDERSIWGNHPPIHTPNGTMPPQSFGLFQFKPMGTSRNSTN